MADISDLIGCVLRLHRRFAFLWTRPLDLACLESIYLFIMHLYNHLIVYTSIRLYIY